MSTNPPTLHLLLPGLLWPTEAMQNMVFDLPLPALSWLLGKGSRQLAPAVDTQSWLAGIVGLPQLPAAALRLGASADVHDQHWLCLDPIHLRIERTQLVVDDPSRLALTLAEAEQLQQDLLPFLDELGELHISTAQEWHLRLPGDSHIRTTPLPEAIGLNGEQLLPHADNVKVWRRVLNEVQMVLHEHPVNLERSARGLPVVNCLWPWGEGSLENAAKPEWHTIAADGSLWQGLARHLNARWTALPQSFASCSGKTFVLDTTLAGATQRRDAMQWRASLQELETHWFAPLMEALNQGKLDTLVIHGHGEAQAMTITVGRNDRLRFWRKPAALTTLGVQEARA
jgi:hypothetical protein